MVVRFVDEEWIDVYCLVIIDKSEQKVVFDMRGHRASSHDHLNSCQACIAVTRSKRTPSLGIEPSTLRRMVELQAHALPGELRRRFRCQLNLW